MTKQKEKSTELLNKLSSHLFWDVDRAELESEKHKKFILHRVLVYGLLSDWLLISRYYGKEDIVKSAMQLKHLDSRSLAFISAYSGITKEKFACYTMKQSIPPHWNY